MEILIDYAKEVHMLGKSTMVRVCVFCVCMRVHVCKCLCLRACVCVYVFVCVRVHVCMYQFSVRVINVIAKAPWSVTVT
jgi:hypothetical protein